MTSGVDIRVSEEMQKLARQLSAMIDEVAGEPLGFTLFIYTNPRASYISNVERTVAIQEIRHLLDLWDQGMPDVPAHKFD